MKAFKVVAITHKKAGLEAVGAFHLDDEKSADFLKGLKEAMNWDELMYLSTCNRAEFYVVSQNPIQTQDLLNYFDQGALPEEKLEIHTHENAVDHLFRVASSLDSMVVGEREIITQVRSAFEKCRDWGLTGDNLRLAIRKTIEHAKRIFTETAIANHPVSVVSLAFKQFMKSEFPKDSKIVMIGSGQTNRSMARFLTKNGWTDIDIYNRTLKNGQKLAEELNLTAYPLSELDSRDKGCDVIFTCTGAEGTVLSLDTFKKITQDNAPKLIVDLAIPEDTDVAITELANVEYISVKELKPIAERNLKQREGELVLCEHILGESMVEFEVMLHERKVERAMKAVPEKVKEIKAKAIEKVFHEDISGLDENSKEVLEKVMNYLEKKYISVPMKLAKEIILDKRYEER